MLDWRSEGNAGMDQGYQLLVVFTNYVKSNAYCFECTIMLFFFYFPNLA